MGDALGSTYKAIDIFSGCGGVSCGLVLAGYQVKAAVEIDETAVNTYLAYPPLSSVRVLRGSENGDIRKINSMKLLETAGIQRDEIYLVAGCPPCQSFSYQNPRNASKSNDERKALLFEFLRIIEELLPPFILLENVPGIKSSYNQSILNEFLERMRLHYIVVDGILNAADYGVPQIRKRYVLHAVRKDLHTLLVSGGRVFRLPTATHSNKKEDGLPSWRTAKEAIGDLPAIAAGQNFVDNEGNIINHRCANLREVNLKRIRAIRANGGSRSGLPEEMVLDCHKKRDSNGRVFSGHSDVYGVMDADKPSPTMTAGCLFYSKGRYGHYSQDRAISIREAARLQTFPDDFCFNTSLASAAKQIGNAVPIKLVQESGFELKKSMRFLLEKSKIQEAE